ncbi:unnamed protein product [Orchesella dallaii]|uniref:Uncharacterized protein n=1 Tax=Orchesella dallaii TaxID=48710 RepID=A0ABP1R0I2_9HEXA
MLPFLIIILLTLAQDGLMVSKPQYPSHYNQNLIPSPQLNPFEMDTPEHLEALGSRLTVRIRLSPSLLNTTGLPESGINVREMYLQLGLYEANGDKVMLTQEKIKRAISTNWQEVQFDCGWIVKGGIYFVHLVHYGEMNGFSAASPKSSDLSKDSANDLYVSSTLQLPSESPNRSNTLNSPQWNQHGALSNQADSFNKKESSESTESSSPSVEPSGRASMLAKKTINVKYPTILFEVPSRLETYTTSAPVTFGLTKTICKPKLQLPSTVLTLTMCSYSPSENSGPSANHFSSNIEDEQRRDDGMLDVSAANPLNKPTSLLMSPAHNAAGDSVSTHHHREYSHNRDHHHHHRRYNPDHHLSQSGSTQPLKSFKRQNTSEDGRNSGEEKENRIICHRDVTTIYQEPFIALETEGRVTINVDCQLWGRNATYVIQLRETGSRSVIAQSTFISVEWSSQFSLKLSKGSILRCQGSIRALVSHPQCILPGRDKIRVYGYETLPVPSLLAPSRMSYIGEKQIQEGNRFISFRCSLFPARFLRFCFQYVNTAVDDSVAVVLEKCIPTGPANQVSDGGWSEWSKWSSCSVTCGSGGKRFRYRFCDSPPPTSGANFCQGKAIQEEPCDTGIPCPQIPGRRPQTATGQEGAAIKSNEPSSPGSPTELDHFGRDGGNRKYLTGSGHATFMDLSVLNVSTTPGCECGCILYDLVPTKNYSLVILISANQSSCADEDEEDHHNFRWILHAKNEKDRIRLDVVGMDVQCITMTFRDGNTTDSNLIEVITASQPSDPIQFEGMYERELGQQQTPVYNQQPIYEYDDEVDDENDSSEDESEEDMDDHEEDDNTLYERNDDERGSNMQAKGISSILRIESTGPSLSIGTTSDATKNCTGQFIYFIAYYTTIRSTVSGIAERKEEIVGYDFWTFLFLKIMVLFFISVVICSTFGGCVTKLYRKYKYKELKCFENEDEEEGSLNDDGSGGRKTTRDTRDDASRCTSITLMSFDYSYWRRLRILRLKYFLLRPRPLDPITTKIKSFPNTPTVSTRRKEDASTSAGRNIPSTNTKSGRSTTRGDEPVSKIQKCDDHHNPVLLNKPISLSETNLREKSAVLAVTKNGYELRRPKNKKSAASNGENDSRKGGCIIGIDTSSDPKHGTNPQDHGSVSDMYGGDGNASLTSTSVSISMSQSLNGSETASSNSITTPTPTPLFLDNCKKDGSRLTKGELRSSGIKLLKEQENLKRKAGGRREKGCSEDGHIESTTSLTPRSLSSSENSNKGMLKKYLIRKDDGRGKRKPKLILKHGDSTASVSTVQSARMSSTCDDDSSRVASRADLEDTDQDFEMDYYDYDVGNAGNIPGSYLGLEPAFVLWNSEVYNHSEDEEEHDPGQDSPLGCGVQLGDDTHGNMDDSAYGIEMTPSSSSIGMFSTDSGTKKQYSVEETSLDTLKFADDEDDELESFSESAVSVPITGKKDAFVSKHTEKYQTTVIAPGSEKS